MLFYIFFQIISKICKRFFNRNWIATIRYKNVNKTAPFSCCNTLDAMFIPGILSAALKRLCDEPGMQRVEPHFGLGSLLLLCWRYEPE